MDVPQGPTGTAAHLRRHLNEIVERGIEGAAGGRLVERALTGDDPVIRTVLTAGRTTLVSAGKTAAAMGRAWLAATDGRVEGGVVAATAGECSDERLDVFHVGHPVPTDSSVAAGRRALELARTVRADAWLVVLLSGGASAALAVPADGLTLADKVAATEALLRRGVAIDGINCVRKHLSAIKGGRLAAATGGAVLTLAVSDVVGPVPDDPAVIGSGPTAADPTSFADAGAVIERFGLTTELPEAAIRVIADGRRGARPETPKPGDPALRRSVYRVVGSRRDAMAAAAATARGLGYAVAVVEPPVVGEARTAGAEHGDRVREAAATLPRPVCVISSGETTVEVRGPGRGGRNQELALASVDWLTRMPGETVLASVGTDGVDGPTDAAGAVVDRRTSTRGRARGMGDWVSFLERNDSYAFFDGLGDLLRFGPTETNVGDLQVVLMDHDDG